MHTHWSQCVPNMSSRHPRTLSSTSSSPQTEFIPPIIKQSLTATACRWYLSSTTRTLAVSVRSRLSSDSLNLVLLKKKLRWWWWWWSLTLFSVRVLKALKLDAIQNDDNNDVNRHSDDKSTNFICLSSKLSQRARSLSGLSQWTLLWVVLWRKSLTDR